MLEPGIDVSLSSNVVCLYIRKLKVVKYESSTKHQVDLIIVYFFSGAVFDSDLSAYDLPFNIPVIVRHQSFN